MVNSASSDCKMSLLIHADKVKIYHLVCLGDNALNPLIGGFAFNSLAKSSNGAVSLLKNQAPYFLKSSARFLNASIWLQNEFKYLNTI